MSRHPAVEALEQAIRDWRNELHNVTWPTVDAALRRFAIAVAEGALDMASRRAAVPNATVAREAADRLLARLDDAGAGEKP